MDERFSILPDRMTHEQVAAEFGICPRTLDRWHALGESPPRIKVGRQIYYRGSSVRKWLESREKAAA